MNNGDHLSKILCKLFLPKSLGLLLLLVIILFISTIPFRYIHLDEAWLGEQAYWLAQKGYVKSELFRGFANYEVRQLVYHKLFIEQGSWVINLFGWDPYINKAVLLFYLIAFCIIIKKYISGLFPELPNFYYLFLLLLLSSALIIEFSFTFRPEVMLMVLGFLSYWSLEKSIKVRSAGYSFLSGLMAGACALTHLNGLIFIGAGALTLLANRAIKNMLIFVSSALIAFSPYFYDTVAAEAWSLFKYQFVNDPAYESSDFKVSVYFQNVLDEHMRFFHSSVEASMTVLFIICCFAGLKYKLFQGAYFKNLFIYLGALILLLALITHSNTSKYIIPYLPFMLIIIAFVLLNLAQLSNWLRITLPILFIVLITSQINYMVKLIAISKSYVEENYQAAARLHLQKGQKVLAPIYFIFNEIPHYEIQALACYDIMHKKELIKLDSHTFFKLAKQFEREGIVLDRLTVERYQISTQNSGDYKFLGKNKDFYFFKLEK